VRETEPLLHLIVNPTAGRGTSAKLLPAIEAALTRYDRKFQTTITTQRGHARQIADNALVAGGQIVVAVGGDGTLHEVTNAVIDADPAKEPTLGLIACGTGNDFARCLGLTGTVDEMCTILARGERRYVDVGTIVGHDLSPRHFLVAAGVGYIADTATTVNRGIRYLRGMPAYILGAIQTLRNFQSRNITLKFDNLEPRTVDAMLISISNVATTGGGMIIAPGALADDGLLNICLVKKISKFELLRQLPNVIKGLHINHPAVEMLTATSVEITSEIPLQLWIDGEVIGSTPAKVSVEFKRLPMLLPHK
jgi:YegS/Rv2252/BmrU family lipid kinase